MGNTNNTYSLEELSQEILDYEEALKNMRLRQQIPEDDEETSENEEEPVYDRMDINSTESIYSLEENKNDNSNFSSGNDSHNNEKNVHRQAAETTQKKKGGIVNKLKELPAKANHIKQRSRLWMTKMGHFSFYRKYLDRLQSGLYDKCAGEAPIYENRMKGDPVQILKNEAQTYIRDIVHELNGLYQQVLKLSDNLKDKVTAEQCIGVIKDYCSEYASETDAHGGRIDRDKMGWNKKLLDATKFKIAKILLRNGQHKVYGYTMRSMVQKGYPKANYLIVCLFVDNPEERPDKQVVSDIFSGPDSFEILADADKKDIFSVAGMTEAVLSKTVDNNIMNEIKLSRSNALNMFKAREIPNKKDEAKIIDQIWDGIKDASKELLSRKAYLIDCINVYFDMILRIDKLAYNSMKSMLEIEAEKLDKKYKNQSAFDRAKSTHTTDSDGNRVTKTEDRINKQMAYRDNGRSTNSEGKVKAKEVKDITKQLNKTGRFH